MREITIQLTERCNLSCPYCFAGSKSGAEISGDDLKYFMDFCRENDVESIHITGGEPMLFSDFRRCIEKLSDIAYLVIYSNFTVRNMIRNMNLHGRDLIFLVNVNHRENYTDYQWGSLVDNIESAQAQGVRLAFGHTFHRETVAEDFEYIVGMNRRYNVKLLRLSQAISNDNAGTDALSMEKIRELYSLVADRYETLGIKCYFDCPLPACWIGEKTYAKLREGLIISTHCEPKVFVTRDLSVRHCYIEPKNLPTRSLRSFVDYDDAYKYSSQRIRSILPSTCDQCAHSEFSFGCGCPVESSYRRKDFIEHGGAL